ncbi:MAG: hypothetical protein QXI91_05345 [Candidatus Bathyarchaeia archaeon]
MSEFENLTAEEKVKLIGGLVVVFAAIFGSIFFVHFALDRSQIDRLWASGASFFYVTKTLLPSFYLFICLPPSISSSVTIAVLRRRFSYLALGLFLLAITGFAFLLIYLLLSLFDLLFANTPLETQAIFMLLAFFIPGILLALILKARKVNNYLRKAFGERAGRLVYDG